VNWPDFLAGGYSVIAAGLMAVWSSIAIRMAIDEQALWTLVILLPVVIASCALWPFTTIAVMLVASSSFWRGRGGD